MCVCVLYIYKIPFVYLIVNTQKFDKNRNYFLKIHKISFTFFEYHGQKSINSYQLYLNLASIAKSCYGSKYYLNSFTSLCTIPSTWHKASFCLLWNAATVSSQISCFHSCHPPVHSIPSTDV